MPQEPFRLLGLDEGTARLVVFLSAMLVFSVLEAVFPRRPRRSHRLRRWWANGSLLVVATLCLRIVILALPMLAGSAAVWGFGERGFGVLRNVDLPEGVELALALVLLDLAIWLQHFLSHRVPLLWRIHRVHHSDLEVDASTALRFHPAEILLSALYKLALVAAIGPSLFAFVLFEILLNASAIFNHANLALPLWLERPLRWVLVTPDLHRIHHSVVEQEQRSNFGFCLSCWDRCLGTFRGEPERGQSSMSLGLEEFREPEGQGLAWVLALPLDRSDPSSGTSSGSDGEAS